MLCMTMRSTFARSEQQAAFTTYRFDIFESANHRRDCDAFSPGDRRALLFPLAKQPELRGIARRLGEAEMAEGVRREQASARGALDETFLDQKRLDDLLDGVARLRQRRRDGLDPDRPAAIVLRDVDQIAP